MFTEDRDEAAVAEGLMAAGTSLLPTQILLGVVLFAVAAHWSLWAGLLCGPLLLFILSASHDSYLGFASPAASVWAVFRTMYLCKQLSAAKLPELADATLITAPYAAAFAFHSLLIGACHRLRRGDLMPHSWWVLSTDTLVSANVAMSTTLYGLFVVALFAHDAGVRFLWALTGTVVHAAIFAGLAVSLRRASASVSTHVRCFGIDVRLSALLGGVCGCLGVQACMTLLAMFARGFFMAHYAVCQSIFFGAELAPLVLHHIVQPPPAAAAPPPRRSALVARLRQMVPAAERLAVSTAMVRALSWRTTRLVDDLPDSCSICLEPLRRGDAVLPLACTHTFHAGCLRPWLLRSASCPNCKARPRLKGS